MIESGAFSNTIAFLMDAFQFLLDTLSNVWMWLLSSVTIAALVWYVLGVLTPSPYNRIRTWFRLRKIQTRIKAIDVENQGNVASDLMNFLSDTCPKTLAESKGEEIENIMGTLSQVVEIGISNLETDWERIWSEMDPIWAEHFVLKCRLVHEPQLQEALAKAFMYQARQLNCFSYPQIDTLTAMNIQDWSTFTAICRFACSIDGRITPVIFNYTDEIYRTVGLNAEALDSLIAAGLITQRGTGEVYTLVMPANGLRVIYLNDHQFTVMPLSAPIPRSYLGRTLIRPHPFDTNLNVGVVDFTDLGRAIGLLTPCTVVDGFIEYLMRQWQEHIPSDSALDE